MQSGSIYIAVLTCDFRRNDKTLEGVATFMKIKIVQTSLCRGMFLAGEAV